MTESRLNLVAIFAGPVFGMFLAAVSQPIIAPTTPRIMLDLTAPPA